MSEKDLLQFNRAPNTFLFSRLMELSQAFVSIGSVAESIRPVRCRYVMDEMFRLLLIWKYKEEFSCDLIHKTEMVTSYIQRHFNEKISLKELADLAGVTEFYLCQIFRQIIGKTPIEYLIQVRLEKARGYLKAGYPVTETAEKTGFHDVCYFSRCFKKQEGISPSSYKDYMEETRKQVFREGVYESI